MEYRELGRGGPKVSAVGFGAWQFSGDAWGPVDRAQAKATVERAVALGITLFDTAQVYGKGRSEELLGSIIRELGVRDELVIATKVPGDWLRPDDLSRATEGSLRRLRVEAIDLYQIHWPALWHNIPLKETMRAMERLVDEGKVRYIGVSNFPNCLLEEARSALSHTEIVSNQVRYNLIEREVEAEIWPYLKREGIGLMAWSPIAKGALSGKYRPDRPPSFQDVRANDPLFRPKNLQAILPLLEALEEIGRHYDKTPAQVALNWLLYDSLIVPIPGAKSPEQAEANAGAAGWRMSREEWARLERLSRGVQIDRVT
jgi:aryl-alcohol dehydrogenase-like predicted oxidoreductase